MTFEKWVEQDCELIGIGENGWGDYSRGDLKVA